MKQRKRIKKTTNRLFKNKKGVNINELDYDLLNNKVSRTNSQRILWEIKS
ncbi:hypothetical protein [Synechococcus phage BUCT-ZZ01]|nr:hypothetical protein [Synechococcus phage BUCT-ZZ01]